MSTIACWTVAVLVGLAYVVAALLVVLVYRRTKNTGFLWLLGALFMWPLAESCLLQLMQHFTREVMSGHTPSLFPYSLMSLSPKSSGWQMPPEEFITKTHALLSIVRHGMLLSAMFFIARGFGALPRVKPSGAPDSQTASPAESRGEDGWTVSRGGQSVTSLARSSIRRGPSRRGGAERDVAMYAFVLACGVCTDGFIVLGAPFMLYWTAAFLIWAVPFGVPLSVYAKIRGATLQPHPLRHLLYALAARGTSAATG